MFGASPGTITHLPASSTNAECTAFFLCNARGRRAAQHAAEADGRGLEPHKQSRSTPTAPTTSVQKLLPAS
jgi:hypothetical protein